MNETALFSVTTLLIGWLLGRLSASVEKTYERRASRNRLVFHLIEIFEDVAKRKIADDVLLSYSRTEHNLRSLRRQFREIIPNEADKSLDHLHATIRETASYDPHLAQEVNSTLLPAQIMDQQLVTAEMDNVEFEVMLRSLAVLDTAMLKRLQLLSEEIAGKNGFFQKKKTRAFFNHRFHALETSIKAQQKIREIGAKTDNADSTSKQAE